MGIAKKLTLGVLYQGVFMVSSALLTFLITPYLIHSLGNRWYGIWVLILAFFASYELFDISVSVAVSRYVSRALGSDDQDEMNLVISTSFFIFLAYGIIVALVTAIAAVVCRQFFADPQELQLVRRVVLIMGFGMAANFPLKIFRGVLVSYLRYDIIQKVALGRVVFATGLMYAALTTGRGLAAIAAISVGCRLAESLIMIVFAQKVFAHMRVGFTKVRRRIVGQMFGYGGKALLSQLASMMRYRLDAIVIAGVLNMNLVAVYDVGQKLVSSGQDIVRNSLNVMIPVFSRDEGRNDYAGIREKYLALTKVSVILAVFAGGSLLMYGKALIRRWVGPDFEDSYAILAILAIPMTIEMIQTSNIQLLFGISKHQYYAYLNIAEGFVNVLLSITLARWYGIYGVALGTAIEVVAVQALVLPWLTCREVGIPLRQYYLDILATVGGKVALPLLLYYFLTRGFIESSYLRLVLLGTIQTLVFIPVVYFLVMGAQERQLIRAILRRGKNSAA